MLDPIKLKKLTSSSSKIKSIYSEIKLIESKLDQTELISDHLIKFNDVISSEIIHYFCGEDLNDLNVGQLNIIFEERDNFEKLIESVLSIAKDELNIAIKCEKSMESLDEFEESVIDSIE